MSDTLGADEPRTVQDPPTTLVREVDKVDEQLGRADNKAGLTLALFFGLAVYLADLAGRRSDGPALAVWLVWAGAAVTLASALLVAYAVRPVLNLNSGRAYGFMAYIQVEPGPALHQAIADSHTEEALEHRLVDLSWVAYRRHGRIRVAIHCAVAGLVVAVFAAVLNGVLS